MQQLAQKSENKLSGAHTVGDGLHLRYDFRKKIVPYHSASSLSILFTLPGGDIKSAYIANYMPYWRGVYLRKDDKKIVWNNKNINRKIEGYNENIENIIDSVLVTNDEIEESIDSILMSDEVKGFITSKKAKATAILGEIRQHEPITLPFCGDCDPGNENL